MGARPPRVKAVLFDLGGTLVDECNFIAWAKDAQGCLVDLDEDALAHAYQQVETETDAAATADRPNEESRRAEFWRRVLSVAAERDVPLATAERFLDAQRGADRPVRVFSDTRRCLDQLAADHRELGVVSNSSSEARVRQLLDRGGILDYFSRVLSSGTEGVAKPNPEIFLRAIRRLGVRADEALYVGNLPNTDARGAAAAGLHAVWLNRAGTGLGTDPPEITSLLEVPLCVRHIEAPEARPAGAR